MKSKSAGIQPGAVKSIPFDMPVERVVIDRELKSMLERDGFDLHAIAELLIDEGCYFDPTTSEAKYAWTEVGNDIFELVQEGLDPPVMSGSVPVGTACYHGDYIYVRELLPQTICLSVVGYRLGDVVSTGIPRLDDRRIAEAAGPRA